METTGAKSAEPRTASLSLSCPLRLGLAAKLTQLIYSQGGRILYHDQNVDSESKRYFTFLTTLPKPLMRGPSSNRMCCV